MTVYTKLITPPRDYAMIVFSPIVLNILAFGLAPLIAAGIWWLFGKNAALLFYASVLGYYLLMQLIHVLCHLDQRNKSSVFRVSVICGIITISTIPCAA